jgi:hypothetical protein
MLSSLENQISKTQNLLLFFSVASELNSEVEYLKQHFCGMVSPGNSDIPDVSSVKRIYLCGFVERIPDFSLPVFIIEELSSGFEAYIGAHVQLISLGKVPIVVSNAGVFYRQLFSEKNYFDTIKSEHEFQHLTESNKESLALRKGIYLTDIRKEMQEGSEALHFRLLRCSSNLTGPTDNLRDTDRIILNALKDCVDQTFEKPTTLNHVLVQIYENKKKSEDGKEVKSKIKAHSDKTKDMPKEGLIAFCTFYDHSNWASLKPSKADRYDWCYKETSALTKLHFKLKSTVQDESLEKEFSVTLYPNSVFLIPLSTNRLYTHEIRPSVLNVDQIPVRMGYVVRCSNLEAVFKDNQTYIKENDQLIKLEEMNSESMEHLRKSYYEENSSEQLVEYGKVHFSMNSGDYQKPNF